MNKVEDPSKASAGARPRNAFIVLSVLSYLRSVLYVVLHLTFVKQKQKTLNSYLFEYIYQLYFYDNKFELQLFEIYLLVTF